MMKAFLQLFFFVLFEKLGKYVAQKLRDKELIHLQKKVESLRAHIETLTEENQALVNENKKLKALNAPATPIALRSRIANESGWNRRKP